MAVRHHVCILLSLTALLSLVPATDAQLAYRFYKESCPQAEEIVALYVAKALLNDVTAAAPLLRLHFHDCFVRGCDASLLLDGVNNIPAEKDSDNNFSLTNFDTVDAIKAQLEADCPGVVSCADLLALAARDAVFLVGGPFVPVKTGRRDGFVSFANETGALPGLTSIDVLIQVFKNVGLNLVDMITLQGSHTIGVTHCNDTGGNRITGTPTVPIDPTFRKILQATCIVKNAVQNSSTIPLDIGTPAKFDNQYYKNLLKNFGTLVTDEGNYYDNRTVSLVKKFAADQKAFFKQYVTSLLKMSEISVLTGTKGEIRKNCHKKN
jgi:peroxidase